MSSLLVIICSLIIWTLHFLVKALTITYLLFHFTTSLQDPIVSIAPKKPNWDLRRDVAKKLEKLEKRTHRAIVELMSKCPGLQLGTCIPKHGIGNMSSDDIFVIEVNSIFGRRFYKFLQLYLSVSDCNCLLVQKLVLAGEFTVRSPCTIRSQLSVPLRFCSCPWYARNHT